MEIKRSNIENLGDCLQAISPYIGGSVPADSTSEYQNLVRWISLAQEDAAKRAQWRRLLTKATLSLTAGDTEVLLPDDFHRRNGLFMFIVGDVDWSEQDNPTGALLNIVQDQTTGKWKILFNLPIESDCVATVWYFFLPPTPVEQTDPLFLDGEMIMFGALKEHFRKARQPGSQDDARIEYENRLREQLSLDNTPTKQEIMRWSYPEKFKRSDRGYYYSGRR